MPSRMLMTTQHPELHGIGEIVVKNGIFYSTFWQISQMHLCLPPTVAVDRLPNFLAAPTPDGKPGPHHQCSIHINCESVEVLETAYKEAMNGRPSSRFTQSRQHASLQIPQFKFCLRSSALSWKATVVEVEITSNISTYLKMDACVCSCSIKSSF